MRVALLCGAGGVQINGYPIDTWTKATLAVAPLFSATEDAVQEGVLRV